MCKFLRSTIVIFWLSFSNQIVFCQSVVPQNLTTEYLTNPTGIDERTPRFSWNLKATNQKVYGQKQSAYRIIVDEHKLNIQKGIGNAWDSKWQSSNEMGFINYAGQKLESDKTYYWQVLVKDEKGILSKSSTNSFSTGLFNETDWTAKWIGSDQSFDPKVENCNMYDPWLRKSFTLKFKPQRATLFLASIGYHELYVNGKKIGDEVLSPAVTDLSNRSRYLAYNIADALKPGKNVIAIWLGTGWSVFASFATPDKPRTPMALAQVDVYGPGKDSKERIVTDATWRTHYSPNKLLGNWSFRNMGGEIYDANREVKNWNGIEFDDLRWENATVYRPQIKVSAQMVEGNRLFEEIHPVLIEDRGANVYRVDMGVNFAGCSKIRVSGNPGDTIRFLWSERNQDEMTFNNHSAFVIGPPREGVFEHRFNYASGRWVTIKGLKYKPSLKDITGWQVRTNYSELTKFKSSNDLQNWLYGRICWNFKNLTIGGYVVDCPQRERMGYGGDAHTTSEFGMLNYGLGAFYTKWMEDWRDVQGTESTVGDMNNPDWARKNVTSGRKFGNGVLPHTAPTYWGGGGPAWGGIVVSLPWYVYENYGDTRILEKNFDMIKKWLEFLDSQTKGDLLQRFGGQWDFLGDWLWPNATAEGMNNDKPETLCLNNCFRVYNLRTAAKIARVIGKTGDAERWESQADRSAKAIHAQFFNETDNSYADSSMANMSAAILAEVPPKALRQPIMDRIAKEILVIRKGHIHAGITGGTILFKVLRDSCRDDLIYSMASQTTYPSWGYMRANGATSLWEMWEKDLAGHSMLHSSFLYPGPWYIDGVAGIRLDSRTPGFKKFSVRIPRFIEKDISWAEASFQSPSGLIKSRWRKQNGKMESEVSIPPNCTATIEIPAKQEPDIRDLSGQAKFAGNRNGYNIWYADAGNYMFK